MPPRRRRRGRNRGRRFGGGGLLPLVGGEVAPPGIEWQLVYTDDEATNGLNSIHDSHLGIYVSHYSNRAFISVDNGETWSENVVTGPSGGAWSAYSPTLDRFIWPGNGTGLWYSDNGLAFTQSGVTGLSWIVGAWVPWRNKFLAIRQSSTTQTARWSADGITWSTGVDMSGFSGLVEGIWVAPDHVLVTGGWNNGPTRRSSVEDTWTDVSGLNNSSTTKWQLVWCGARGWRAVGRTSGANLYSSADGATFTNLGAVLPASNNWLGIAYDEATDTLIVWRADATYFSNDGGLTWTLATGAVATLGNETVPGLATAYVPSAEKFVIASDHDILISPPV